MGTSIKFLYALVITVCISIGSYAVPSKIRAVFNGSPSTSITIVFDTSYSGTYAVETNPLLYYGTGSAAVQALSSASVSPTSVNTNSQMRNNIVRLENLNPGTMYYFKIKDSRGETEVYSFETISDQTDRLSLIAGGDSRSNRSVRVNANKLVAKFKPHAVVFDGDMTDTGSPQEWQWWFEDWQYTIDNARRVTPIIPARGNHEANDKFLIELFGTPANVYYTNNFGGNLLKIYTLNSEKAVNAFGAQTTWLTNDLDNSGDDPIYKFAQYHKPMRPHIKSKLEGVAQYAYWANIFYSYSFDIVLEGDAHTSKITHPVIPCTGGYNCDEGFKQDDVNGTVYVGEGCWGAPLRADDDTKIWTRNSGMYNQFKLIFVGLDGIEIRTVLVDNETQVSAVNINNRFVLPVNENIWSTGDVTYLKNRKDNSIPAATLVSPPDNTILYNTNPILLYANAADGNGSIQNVSFYVNGNLVSEDLTAPYHFNYNPPGYGQYLVHIIATDNSGLTSCIDMSSINLVNNSTTITNTSKVNSTTDDAEEYSNGYMDLLNWDLDLGYQGYICGLRFQRINIPPKAAITQASILFTADEVKTNTTDLTISAHNHSFSPTFFVTTNDISSRPKTTSVSWTVANWTQVGAVGSAQTTPNLKNIVQSLVDRPDWDLSSPMTFIFEGTGYRVSETVDGDSIKAPILSVTYSTSQAPPIVNFVQQQDTISCLVNDVINLNAVALIPSSSLSQIQFKLGNTVIGTSSSNPAQITIPTGTSGVFSLKAIATDNSGMTGEDELYINIIGGCETPTGLTLGDPKTQRVSLSWNQIDPSTKYDIKFKKSTSNTWTTIDNGTSEVAILTDLDPITQYQVRICSDCSTNMADCTSIKLFSTTGNCTNPNTVIEAYENSTISNSSIINWDIAVDATYKVLYKKSGAGNSWNTYCTVHPLVLLYGLEPCTTYQWRVQLVCEDYETCDSAPSTGYMTPIKTLSTTGCKTAHNIEDSTEQLEGKIAELSVFPTPLQNNLHVEFELMTNNIATVQIIDLNGKVIYSKEVEGIGSKSVNFDVSGLAKGTYIVLVNDGFQQKTHKVVK